MPDKFCTVAAIQWCAVCGFCVSRNRRVMLCHGNRPERRCSPMIHLCGTGIECEKNRVQQPTSCHPDAAYQQEVMLGSCLASAQQQLLQHLVALLSAILSRLC